MMLQPRMAFYCLAVTAMAAADQPPSPAALAFRPIALPGAPATGVVMDYIAYERGHHRVWVPAGNTGSVDVIDTRTGAVTRIEGFPTTEIERNGTKRPVGPSSATVGDGVVYVGNRADNTVCAVSADTLKKSACVTLDVMPDGLAYVPSTREVWVTAPRVNSLIVLDAAKPAAPTVKTKIELPGQPEGFAVDDGRGLFYTNLEDKDRTLTVDVKTKKVTRTWMPECGKDGPRGLAVDAKRNLLIVACTDRVRVLDAGHDGRQLSTLEVGEGIDDVNYVDSRQELFAAAGRAAKMIIARLGPDGALATVASVATAPGARNAVATEDGVAYLTDARGGKILVVERPAAR
jgi:DNA-binding beta-propeller fold protein YncE